MHSAFGHGGWIGLGLLGVCPIELCLNRGRAMFCRRRRSVTKLSGRAWLAQLCIAPPPPYQGFADVGFPGVAEAL